VQGLVLIKEAELIREAVYEGAVNNVVWGVSEAAGYEATVFKVGELLDQLEERSWV